ncbi:glycosyltransferase [Dyadobacter sp. LJ53]|uniref:glycosyltransferase family 2 protein n=1 Tax=Dyadobacter chenwenxiniae TaxID=2906456 RepID=UPI001F35AE56|nr:glycosyltransferase family 2 protein [Dyadobacter chenwenxiniae]MCF0051775.1 glycosyltransferase [Dyadobacter chenwenxiniae]
MKISVCIPTYNQAAYVGLTIRSVMVQTLLPDEIIVSDDCSTDETWEILEKLATEIGIMSIIRQKSNKGLAGNTDDSLRAATGDYIVKLDSDDALFPDYIKTLSTLLTEHPQAGYAHAAVREIDHNGYAGEPRRLLRGAGFVTSENALKWALKGYRVAANILMFRREALEKAGYIQCRQDFAEDYFLSVCIAKAGYGNVYSPEILSAYRVWTDQGNVRKKRKLAEINGLNAVFNYALTPAFEQLSWDLKPVERAKQHFAITHSGCLSWDVYNQEEKRDLETAILQLSSTPATKFYIWSHKHGFGKVIELYQSSSATIKKYVKKLILTKPRTR